MVEYWHWHSIHNSAETYWKGVLSHDLEPNEIYKEVKTIGKDFERLSPKLINLKTTNQVAILFSNEALTAFNQFKPGGEDYNDMLRRTYDALYKMNVGVDFVDPTNNNIEKYKLLVVPALYAAPDSLLEKLNRFVKNSGHIVYTFKSGFSDQNVKVRTSKQPGIIGKACGISYDEFTIPKNVTLKGNPFGVAERDNWVSYWMELITPTTAKVLAYYDHPVWGKYAAITQNNYGKGLATYICCWISNEVTSKILEDVIKKLVYGAMYKNYRFPLLQKLA